MYRFLIHVMSCVSMILCCGSVYSQDTSGTGESKYIQDTVRLTVSKFQHLSLSGYIQPQFQLAEDKGINSFEGGSFQNHSDSRFMLRRSRLKIEYNLASKTSILPKATFSFQFDATERGVNIRDAFIRWYGPGKRELTLTAGLFNRPFGYEVNLSSSGRESPERGRASQILTPGEKDLGAMVTYEPAINMKSAFRFDVGLFNGQGTSGPTDFDSYKDINARFSVKPYQLTKSITAAAGFSFLRGGWVQDTKYRYEMDESSSQKVFVVDSSLGNIGEKTKRKYTGADFQVVWQHGMGKTELRAENWAGIQSGTAVSTVSPGSLPTVPNYVREFDAWFLYFIQSIVNEKWEAVVKYDSYDPNTFIAGAEIDNRFSSADIKYTTLGVGITRYISGNLKVLAYYAMPKNETTSLAGFTSDIKDNVFTLRMQLKF